MPISRACRCSPVATRAVSVALTLALTTLAGCATRSGAGDIAPNARDGQILTRQDLVDTGAGDAWEALQRSGTLLNIQYTRQGSAPRVTHRGVDSFNLSPEVLLVLDGTHMPSLMSLREIRADNVDYMQILPARVGVVRYGTSGGNGVVVVKTGVPPAREIG